ncbi:SCO2400 family protein [Streptomyces lunaelactis]|uniref:SCO2400 family protein n=1 Tax=Streptomyces lunaelactis TaxID=1535768 RepID=UPI0020C80ECD|nr:hypothetical protein [Streptomyces lunaelactis]NUK26983.1 hypothetical protein [Streptomyces lunaelactis]
MDYCNQCRRHLNGALACAGCGTPVEELRHFSPSAPAADHVFELDEVSEPAGHRRSRREAPPRRKSAGTRRARKPRGRKVLLGTVVLALAAGALSLAELATENGGDGAATAVKEEASLASETPEPTDSEATPEGPAEVTESAVSSSGSVRPGGTGPGKGTGTRSGTGTGTGTGTGSGSGKPTATSSAEKPPSPTSSAGQPSGSAQPSSSGQPTASAPGQTPPPADPAPAPSETCERFLWWCV